MQKYIGTKLIEAEKAVRYYMPNGTKITVAASDEVSEELHQQLAECVAAESGYKVRYPDNYESWSPKDVFEEAYRPINDMNFGLAIEAAKKGKRIAREGWNGKGMYVFLAGDVEFHTDADLSEFADIEVVAGHDVLVLRTAQASLQVGWLASQSDMLAEDWYIVEEAQA